MKHTNKHISIYTIFTQAKSVVWREWRSVSEPPHPATDVTKYTFLYFWGPGTQMVQKNADFNRTTHNMCMFGVLLKSVFLLTFCVFGSRLRKLSVDFV